MALVTKEFKLDLAPGQLRPVVNASQGDIGRPFKAYLYWNGSPWTATGYTAKIRGKKADNTVFEYTATISGSSVTFSTTEQMTIISGPVECELVFSQSGDVIASANFVLMVEESPYDPDAPSESVIPGIEDIVADVVDDVVGDDVGDWLDEHPEATTTVQDGSITKAKINTAFLPEIENAYVTPEQYGAVGDGTTDDTTALQTAVNTGLTVYLKHSYKITSRINLENNQIIFGGSVVIATTNGAFNLANNNIIFGVSFSDIFIAEQTQGAAVIYGDDVEKIKIANCSFSNIHLSYVAHIYGGYVSICNNRVNGYQNGAFVFDGGSNNVDISENEILNGNSTRLNYRYPITLSSYQTDSSAGATKNAVVRNNRIEDTTAHWEAIDSHAVENCIIDGNTIKGTKKGIVCTVPTSADYLESKNIVISNNDIDVVTEGIVLATSGTHYKIENNNIKCSATDNNVLSVAIRTNAYKTGVILGDVSIVNNYVLNSTSYGGGVYMSGDVRGFKILENNFNGGTNPSQPTINLSGLSNYTHGTIKHNSFGQDAAVNRCFRGVTNSVNNPILIDYTDNYFINYTEKSRDVTYCKCERSPGTVPAIVGGLIGDYQPNSTPTTNNILGWYATTDSDPTNGIKATWTPISYT